MDIPPTEQQEVCNAWSGWMNNLGSVVGFFAGYLDLVKYFSPYLGDSQIKILANLAMMVFGTCLAICCSSVKEMQYQPTEEDRKRSVWSTLGNIWRAFRHLPEEIQRICNVQFFAWMGWFPFLFYSTTWVGEILHRYDVQPDDPSRNNTLITILNYSGGGVSSISSGDETTAERAGSFALLCWAGVAVVCGIVIPKITPQEIGPEVWPRNPFTLRNLWTMSLAWFAVCMGLTWFVDDLWAATGVIALCGVPWAVAMWIPFAMVGEIISDMKDRLEGSDENLLDDDDAGYGTISPVSTLEINGSSRHLDEGQSSNAFRPARVRSHSNSSSSRSSIKNHNDNEDGEEHNRRPTYRLIGNRGLSQSELENERRHRGPTLDAGLVLGVHNMYIVFPQFADAIIASCLFAMIGSFPREGQRPPVTGPQPVPGGDGGAPWLMKVMAAGDPEPVGWVLRFGGVMALVAAYLTRRL
ncbi:hypothetical protein BGZ54_000811 [Gamsiella multidivaricata]|nr:hypothetical protein BGZ54_000811 [Gamsiella multidivaricata]